MLGDSTITPRGVIFLSTPQAGYPDLFVHYCATLQLKLTSLRKEVLYVLWSATKPLKAYEILNGLLKLKPNSTPPTVYRALEFFETNALVHKIESIQCYTLCCEPHKHLPLEVLMVCGDCHQVIEIYDEEVCVLFARLASTNRFQLRQDAIELKGTCQDCV